MERTCSMPGCHKPHRAKGLCSTCYNQQLPVNQRHAKVTVACAQCGAACVKDKTREKRYGALFCGYPCREVWKVANGYITSTETIAKMHAARATPRARAGRKLRRAARGTIGVTWAGGSCRRCSKPFVSMLRNDIGRYCSDRCAERARNSRRRARLRDVEHQLYTRSSIFERDGWRCHICRRKVSRMHAVPHPDAAVIDHLIPLVDGGPDAPHNVACAHFMCNSVRRDVGQAQLLLFG